MRLVQVITDYIRRSILTTKGDLVVRGDSLPERLPSGALNTYLRGKGAGQLPAYEAITTEAWTAPTLLNSWVNFGAGYTPAGYFKDLFGVVHLRGLIRNGTGIPTDICILPVGYRSAYRETHAVQTSPNVLGQAGVYATGHITAAVGSTAWFCLDGISFRTP